MAYQSHVENQSLSRVLENEKKENYYVDCNYLLFLLDRIGLGICLSLINHLHLCWKVLYISLKK